MVQTLLELVFGMGLVLTGDEIREQDNALIILNHPTRYFFLSHANGYLLF